MAVSWVFSDPETLDTYTWEVNPNEGGSPARKKNIEYQNTAGAAGETLVFEGRQEALTGQFSGVVLSEAQYNAMIEWFNKPYPVDYTDDLGRTFRIYITSFDPKRAWSVSHHWRHSYTCNFIVIEEEPA